MSRTGSEIHDEHLEQQQEQKRALEEFNLAIKQEAGLIIMMLQTTHSKSVTRTTDVQEIHAFTPRLLALLILT